ncbi:MAG: DUF5666 domain-containing protein [bacterium]|nr:DUF5666 domain-containing protein [bacterium]
MKPVDQKETNLSLEEGVVQDSSGGNLLAKLPKRTKILLGAVVVVVLGSAISTVIILGNNNQSEHPAYQPKAENVNQSLFLSLQSPTDGALAEDFEVTVKGNTIPDTTVLFYTETDQNSVESDNQGQFEGKIALAEGFNSLTVTAFDSQGEEKSLNLDLIYDNQVLGVKAGESQPPGQIKKAETSNHEATVGDVQSVNSNSVILVGKKVKSKTEAMVDKNTKIFNQKNKNVKLNSIKPKDIVAVISSGSANATDGGKIKKAIKIYVKEATGSAEARQTKRRAIYGVITSISGQIITVAHPVHQERTYAVSFNDETVIKVKGVVNASAANLAVGLRIAAVGDLDANGLLLAKRIHVIPGKATGLFEKNPVSTPTPFISVAVTPTVTPTPSVDLTPTPTEIVSPTPTPTSEVTPTETSPTP